ncbi:Ig-like domain-containing protein [Melaminivora alkalimesophila]|nr:hypothetical protein [Melaminivora alkalimesophila]
MSVQVFKGSGDAESAVNAFTSSDLDIHARAILRDRGGQPVPNAIVTFSETGSGLLAFVPESATALTDHNGKAEVDLKAASISSLGATQIVASASLPDRSGNQVEVIGSQNVAISAAVAADPQSVATAINFTEANPSDRSIVIAGSGGNGRSETALLTFTVVDSKGAPIKGVIVDFNVVPAGSVTLNTADERTDSSGRVTASVSSKAQPTSVIVNATVRGRNISTQSDTLTVTTDVATQRGFDLSASKFNMDYDLSGDSSTVNVRIVDRNGNPVSDGVAVVAQASFGRVGSSSRGGCTTQNGVCSVDYQVQNPRPADGIPVDVVFSTQTGQGTQISDSLQLWVTSVSWLNLYASSNTTVPFSGPLNLSVADVEACKFNGVAMFVGTPRGFAAPAGTTITVRSRSGVSTPSIVAGSPTLDRAGGRTLVEFAASGKSGGAAGSDVWVIQFTAGPSKTVKTIELPVSVPACPKPEPAP